MEDFGIYALMILCSALGGAAFGVAVYFAMGGTVN